MSYVINQDYDELSTLQEKKDVAIENINNITTRAILNKKQEFDTAQMLNDTDAIAALQTRSQKLQTKQTNLIALVNAAVNEAELYDIIKQVTADPDAEY